MTIIIHFSETTIQEQNNSTNKIINVLKEAKKQYQMSNLINEFTSTGSKLFFHQEAMQNLRDGKGTPITTHLMPTDICQHACAFCSVATREGNILTMKDMKEIETKIKNNIKKESDENFEYQNNNNCQSIQFF
jgi:2-iminoacetate synthase ThiH